ncbi:MAG: hypothetical protein V4654_12590 [Bdellovibrionota bacterium]
MINKIKNNSDFVALFLGRLFQAIGAIISIRFMTEILPSEQIGLQYMINAAILWFSLVLVNPFGMFINRYLHQWKVDGELVTRLKSINKYFLLIASLSVGFFSLNNYFSFFSLNPETQNLNFLAYAFFYLFLSTWYQSLTSFFNILKFQKIFVFLTNLSQYSGLLIAILLVKNVSNSAHMWLYGLLSGQVFSLCLGLYLFKKHVVGLDSKPVSQGSVVSIFNKKTLAFCYPLAITTFSIWFLSQGYRFIIESLGGLNLIASLGVGLGIALSCASVVEAIVSQYLYPSYYSSLVANEPSASRRAWLELWQKCTSIYIPVIFFAVGNAFLILRILVSEKFLAIETFVILGFCIELLRIMSNVLYISLHGELKTKMSIIPYGTAAVFLLVSLQLLQKFSRFSSNAVLVALIASQCIVLFLMFKSASKNFVDSISFMPLIKLAAKCLPLLVSIFIFSETTPIWILILYAILAGVYLLLFALPKNLFDALKS